MKAGDRIGAVELVDEGPGEIEVARWSVIGPDGGFELLALRPAARTPAAEAAFWEIHRELAKVADPGLVATRHVARDPVAHVIRAALHDATAADLHGTLEPPIVAAIGARLIPAILACGSATAGALLPEDVGITLDGMPILAPRGRPAARVARGAVRHAAPEVLSGKPPDAAAGLYGLGVLLYKLAAGRDPVTRPGEVAPAASSWRLGIPPELDQALEALLSLDPARRASAQPLLERLAAPSVDLRPALGAPAPRHEAVKVSRIGPATPSKGRPARPRSKAAVILPADALLALTPPERSTVAALLALPESEIERISAKGLPLVFEVCSSAAEADARARALVAQHSLPFAAVSRSIGCAPWIAAIAALLASPFVLAFALIVPLAFPLVALGAMATVVGILALRNSAARRAIDVAELGLLALDDARDVSLPEVGRLRERIAGLRRLVLGADLPPAATLDLRGALREVEEQVEAIGRVARSAGDALAKVDPERLRIKLGGLVRQADPAAAPERDRLARAIADVEAVEARRERANQELHAMDPMLDELEALLVRVGTPEANDAGAVQRLLKRIEQTRGTLD